MVFLLYFSVNSLTNVPSHRTLPGMKIFHEFKNNLAKHRLIKAGDIVVVGVSGGSDSVALLHLLHEVSKKMHFSIVVAHVNYHTRGKDSLDDQKLVAEYAKKLDLQFFVRDVRIPKKRKKLNFENFAREARYEFFEKIREKLHAESIAVAHTKDDQAETVLMHFFKGAGLEGLAGMQSKESHVIRPTLPFTKNELRSYLKEYGLRYREDFTNHDNTFTRNKLRNVLLPQLADYNPNFVETLTRNAEIFSELKNYLQLEAVMQFSRLAKFEGDKVRIQAGNFEMLPKPIARELLHVALKKLGHLEPLSQKHFEQVYKVAMSPVSGKKKEISRDLKVTRLHDVILLELVR